MDIKILCIGKIKEQYLTSGINEYLKRCKIFCSLQIIELKEVNTNDIEKNMMQEAKEILENIKESDYVITLEIMGEMYDSISFANIIKKHFVYSSSNIVFVIGGSNGLSNEVSKRSNLKLSFGKVTYPHQLMRLILVEQIYRSMTIINNHKYHK